MKNTMKAFKNMVNSKNGRKILAGVALTYVGLVLAISGAQDNGANIGGNVVLDAAERMTPGFTEQFQKFLSAEKYGWKS